jgi:four helix bundle protein
MQANKENLIVQLTFEFAKDIIIYSGLLQTARFYNIANQLFRSGTSIGANVREAQNAESKADFIHKFKIAAKETDETEYWLMLCDASNGYPDCKPLLEKVASIHKVISKIIASSKASPNHQIIKSPN